MYMPQKPAQQASVPKLPVTKMFETAQTTHVHPAQAALIQTGERVKTQMPPVHTQVAQYVPGQTQSVSRAEAEGRLLRTWKLFGDSGLMKNVKRSIRRLNDALSLPMPKKKDEFHQALMERVIWYDQALAHCRTYLDERKNAIFATGVERLALIREIYGYLEQERRRFETCAMRLFASKQKEATGNSAAWVEALQLARTEALTEVPEGTVFVSQEELQQKYEKERTEKAHYIENKDAILKEFLKEKGAETEDDLDDLDDIVAYEELQERCKLTDYEQITKNKVVISRMAKLLGISHLVEEVRQVTLLRDGREVSGYLEPVRSGISLQQFKKQAKERWEQAGNDRNRLEVVYPPNVLRELSQLSALESVCGFTNNSDDNIMVDVGERTDEQGKIWLTVNSVKLLNPGKLISYSKKEVPPAAMEMDLNVAARILSVSREMLDYVTMDLLSEEARDKLGYSFEFAQKSLQMSDSTYVDEQQYSFRPLRALLNADYVYHGRLLTDNEQLNLMRLKPLPGYNDLKACVSKDEKNVKVQRSGQWTAVLEAAQDYFVVWDQDRADMENADPTRLLDAMRQWHAAVQASGQEQAAFESYRKCVEQMFGDAVFEPKEVPLTNEALDRNTQLVAEAEYEVKIHMEDYTKKVLFSHMPNILDISQGRVGDCYLLSALGALVEQNPRKIMDMMHDNGSTVTVTFPKNKQVTVSKMIAVDDGNTPVAAEGELWVQIMEKAYAASGLRLTGIYGKLNDKKTQLVDKMLEAGKQKMSRKEAEDILKNSVQFLSGGTPGEALEEITGFRLLGNIAVHKQTVDTMDDDYIDLWKHTMKHAGSVPEQLTEPQWKSVRSFLGDYLKKRLREELRLRYRHSVRGDDRALTMEDLLDTLTDMKNWKSQDGQSEYEKLLLALRKSFPELSVTPEFTERILQAFSDELGAVNDTLENGFEHRRQLGDDAKGHYSVQARALYRRMAEAIGKRQILTAASVKLKKAASQGTGQNKEDVNEGVALGHGYSVVKCEQRIVDGREQYFVTLNNPWRTKGVRYRQITDIHGQQSAGMEQGSDDDYNGIFEMELNDFMQYFNYVAVNEIS